MPYKNHDDKLRYLRIYYRDHASVLRRYARGRYKNLPQEERDRIKERDRKAREKWSPERLEAFKATKAEYSKWYYARNKETIDRQRQQRYRKDRESARGHDLKKKYGISFQQYLDLLKAQDGKCAICGKTLELWGEKLKQPHVDHDHGSTGVRGLLCHSCNLGLGYFRDEQAVLHRAIQYLRERGKP